MKTKRKLDSNTVLVFITIALFVVMYAIGCGIYQDKGFGNLQTFLNILINNAGLICVTCGMTCVMLTGGIDISVGGTVALITMASVVFMEDHNGGILSSVLIALGIGLAMGIVQGYFVAYLKIQPFIVTLAGMFFTRGMTTIVSKAPRTASNELFLELKDFEIDVPFLGTWARNGNWIPASIEVGVVIALVVVIVLWAMLKWTRFGRNLYAVGGNNESALMLGINVQRTQFFAYVLCGVLAGIAGFCYLLHTGAGNASNATAAEMQAIASSIIGGTLLSGGVGSVVGTLFGVMSLKTINNIVVASGLREPYWQSITTGLMLCFFILLQSVILSYRKKKLGHNAG